MRIIAHISSGLILALTLVCLSGCAPHPPAADFGVPMQPGHYLTYAYRAPDFDPVSHTYALETFQVETTKGVDPEVFQAQLQEELKKAFAANGLKLNPQSPTALRGTVQQIKICGTTLRFVLGRITAYLTVEGAIRRGDQILFAFQDQVKVTSPLNPGAPAPRERELLLAQAARTFAAHLMDEMLLH